MSAAAPVASSPGGSPLLYGNWTPALFKPHARSIGGIVAEVTIEEAAEDELQITEHPVEQGAPIADHAFKRPSTVTIRAGWSMQVSRDMSAETGVYGLLLSWQASLLPFDLITGKRSYGNMLIERLSVTTDQHSEYALMATLVCRQVIIVGTATTTVQGMSDSQGDHQNPESTAPETDKGTKQPTDFGGPDTGNTTKLNASPASPTASTASTQMKLNSAQPAADPPGPTPGALDLGGNPQEAILNSGPVPQ